MLDVLEAAEELEVTGERHALLVPILVIPKILVEKRAWKNFMIVFLVSGIEAVGSRGEEWARDFSLMQMD